MGVIELWLNRYRWRRGGQGIVPAPGRPAVIITGASEGIGLALADRFAAAGHTLVMIARREAKLQAAALDVGRRHKVDAYALALDVTATDAARQIDTMLDRHGLYADVLVNNAGIGLAGEFVERDTTAIAELIDLNVTALSVLMRHVLPGMLERGRGGIINIASLAGFAPGPYQAVYYASKAYVIALSRAVAYETRGQGVRVSVVAPGPVNTRFHARMGAEASLYRQIVPGASAEAVARSAYRGFRLGLGVVYPGIATPVLALVMRLMPGIVLFPLIGLLLRPRSEDDAGR